MRRLCFACWCLGLVVGSLVTSATSHKQHSRSISAPFTPDAVFQDKWVSQNVALAYSNSYIRDGIGGQAGRLLGLQALACSLGLPYLHTQLERVAHTPDLLARWNQIFQPLPFSSSSNAFQTQIASNASAVTASWKVHDRSGINMVTLVELVAEAAKAKQPTLIKSCYVHMILNQYPDMYHCLPRLKPKPWHCSETSARSVRVAVHIRRGDITRKEHTLQRRGLPVSYFINITNTITKILQSLGRDYLVEVFTESQVYFSPDSPRDEFHMPTDEFFKRLRSGIPNLVLLADMDPVWSLQQMASADVLVQSISSFSQLAGLLNQRGLVVDTPVDRMLHMRHWVQPSDLTGAFDEAGLQKLHDGLRMRYDGSNCSGSSNSSQQ